MNCKESKKAGSENYFLAPAALITLRADERQKGHVAGALKRLGNHALVLAAGAGLG
jgi:hypothetical protein